MSLSKRRESYLPLPSSPSKKPKPPLLPRYSTSPAAFSPTARQTLPVPPTARMPVAVALSIRGEASKSASFWTMTGVELKEKVVRWDQKCTTLAGLDGRTHKKASIGGVKRRTSGGESTPDT